MNSLGFRLMALAFRFRDWFRPRSRILAEVGLVPAGVLSFSDHHMQDDAIVAGVTAGGRFELAHRGRWTHTFTKV